MDTRPVVRVGETNARRVWWPPHCPLHPVRPTGVVSCCVEPYEAWHRTKVTAHEVPRISEDFLEEERRSRQPMFAAEYRVSSPTPWRACSQARTSATP